MKLFNKKKKKDKFYKRSFANRLTWRITLTSFLIVGLASLLVFGITWALTIGGSNIFCMSILNSKCEKVTATMKEVSVASINRVPEIEACLDRPDKLYDIMADMVEKNPRIRSCGLSFIDDYYPKKGHWFCPYAMRDSLGKVKTSTIGDAANDYLKADWFVKAVKSNEGYWARPFFEANDTTMPLTSYVLPIHNHEGQTVAVLGVDLSLHWLSVGLQHITISSGKSRKVEKQEGISVEMHGDDEYNENDPPTIFFFIIDKEGTYIAHPDNKHILKRNFFTDAKETPDTLDEYVGHEMITGHSGYMVKDKQDVQLTLNGRGSNLYYMPVEDCNWSIGLVISSNYVNGVGVGIASCLIALIGIALLVVFFVSRKLIRRSVKPISQLAESANEVAKGYFDTPLPPLKSRDEIHLLRDSFDEMQRSLTQYVNELKTTTAQKSAIESELKIAHDIQMSMLPKDFPPYPERTDIDVYGALTPAKGVGGDLFDFYIRDEQLFFCIGDVSGKGVPASLFMAVTRSLFRNVSSYTRHPSSIVYALNNAMTEGNDTNMFVTLFVGVLDLRTGLLQYCNGGHDAPLLVGRDVGALPCDANLPIGVVADFKFSQQEAYIDPQTTIFLFTDGLNEAENSTHAQFGDLRIWNVAKKLLAEDQHQPEEFIRRMTDAVHEFVGNAEQSDDLTMLAVQYKGKSIKN